MVAWGANAVRLGGDWSSSGDREGETLWPLLSSIFNILLEDERFQDHADLVLGGMEHARRTAKNADRLFGCQPRGWGGRSLADLHSPWTYAEPEILRYANRQFGRLRAYGGTILKTILRVMKNSSMTHPRVN